MESFGPLLSLIILWFLASMISKATKAAKKAVPPKRPAPAPAKNAAPSATAAGGTAKAKAPERDRVLQPSIQVTHHDDSVYQGSLNAVTGEGFDPCHDEQLTPLTLAETAEAEPRAVAPSPLLPRWSGGEIARGFVIAEILKRRESIGR